MVHKQLQSSVKAERLKLFMLANAYLRSHERLLFHITALKALVFWERKLKTPIKIFIETINLY